MNFIDIEYPNGHMRINPDSFFPCKQKEMRIVLKTIDMVLYDNWKIVDQIADYLREKIKNLEYYLEESKKNIEELYPQWKKIKEIEQKMIENGEDNPYVPGTLSVSTSLDKEEKALRKTERLLTKYQKNLNMVEKEILK